MCRKCGEPDRRGSSKVRRHRTTRLLEIHGNGVVCPCTWCGVLLGRAPGYLSIPYVAGVTLARRLNVCKLEQDRLMPGGPYSLWNLVPACGPCNRARALGDPRTVYDEYRRCYFGSVPEEA